MLFRGRPWLKSNFQDQPDFELILMEPKPGMLMDEETSAKLRAIMAKGVQFLSEPTERPYGIEAVFKDNSRNWFSLTQPR